MVIKHIITKQQSLYKHQNDQKGNYNETFEVKALVNQHHQEQQVNKCLVLGSDTANIIYVQCEKPTQHH